MRHSKWHSTLISSLGDPFLIHFIHSYSLFHLHLCGVSIVVSTLRPCPTDTHIGYDWRIICGSTYSAFFIWLSLCFSVVSKVFFLPFPIHHPNPLSPPFVMGSTPQSVRPHGVTQGQPRKPLRHNTYSNHLLKPTQYISILWYSGFWIIVFKKKVVKYDHIFFLYLSDLLLRFLHSRTCHSVLVKWIQMALQLTTSCKILPSRIKGLSGVSNHCFAFMKHDGWWFLDDFGSVLNDFGTFDQASAHECTTSFAGPLSHSDGLTTLQVPEAVHEGSIQKATTHLRSMGPVKWLNIQQLLMVSYEPYKPPSSPSSSDLEGTLSHFSFFFRSDEHNILGEVKSHRTPPKKWVPKQKIRGQPSQNGSHSSSGKYTLHLSKHPTYWLIQYLGTSWRPPGSTSSAVCFFGRFGAERWFGAEKLLSQVDPGSPEFGCSFLKIQVPWQQNLPFQACDNW